MFALKLFFNFSFVSFQINQKILTIADNQVVEPQFDWDYSSLVFVIPVEPPDTLYRSFCQKMSNFYCLSGFVTEIYHENFYTAIEYQIGSRFDMAPTFLKLSTLRQQALKKSEAVFMPMFKNHNFYTVNEGCCERQFNSYYSYGFLSSNLTPDQYVEKLTDYSEKHKSLNLLWSFYSKTCDVNIITKLGFGTGKLKRTHRKSGLREVAFNRPYRLKIGSEWTPDIPYENPQKFLTFNWFKINVVCRDQQWICRRYQRKQNATSSTANDNKKEKQI